MKAMTDKKPAKRTSTKRTSTKRTSTRKAAPAFTAEERAAIKDYVQETRSHRARGKQADPAGLEGEVLAKIAEMEDEDRVLAERIHAVVGASAPDLTSRLWYGMPAYVKDGKVLCFFQPARKFKTRYATFGFSDEAKLDDGTMWPNSYALADLTAADEARIGELVRRAVG